MLNGWMSFVVTGALGLGLRAGAVVAQHPPVRQRKVNQQKRIAQGVRSGQLTAGETRHLEKRESKINRKVRGERVANGGPLTPQERRQVNRQQNRASRQIYRDKHNARTQ